MPANADTFKIADDDLSSIVRGSMAAHRELSPDQFGVDIMGRFESLDIEDKNRLEESGFIVVKFI